MGINNLNLRLAISKCSTASWQNARSARPKYVWQQSAASQVALVCVLKPDRAVRPGLALGKDNAILTKLWGSSK